MLETIHKYVLALDRYYENVCELDIIYGFDQVTFICVMFSRKGYNLNFSCFLGILHIG